VCVWWYTVSWVSGSCSGSESGPFLAEPPQPPLQVPLSLSGADAGQGQTQVVDIAMPEYEWTSASKLAGNVNNVPHCSSAPVTAPAA
jgi:hypothetical protein